MPAFAGMTKGVQHQRS